MCPSGAVERLDAAAKADRARTATAREVSFVQVCVHDIEHRYNIDHICLNVHALHRDVAMRGTMSVPKP